MRVKSLLCVFFLLLMAGGVFAQVQTGSAYPKREFRAAWIQSVNGQFRGMPTEKLKQNLIGQLNSLQKAGINAIIFRGTSRSGCSVCFQTGTVESFPYRSAG